MRSSRCVDLQDFLISLIPASPFHASLAPDVPGRLEAGLGPFPSVSSGVGPTIGPFSGQRAPLRTLLHSAVVGTYRRRTNVLVKYSVIVLTASYRKRQRGLGKHRDSLRAMPLGLGECLVARTLRQPELHLLTLRVHARRLRPNLPAFASISYCFQHGEPELLPPYLDGLPCFKTRRH